VKFTSVLEHFGQKTQTYTKPLCDQFPCRSVGDLPKSPDGTCKLLKWY